MKKKIFSMFFLSVILTVGLFSLEIERLTFTEIRPNGTVIGTVTVNAVFLGWVQNRVSIEGNFLVTRQSASTVEDNGRWTEWYIVERAPVGNFTLRQLCDNWVREYNMYPRGAIRMHIEGLQIVNIKAIPNRRTSPFWWSEDGRSFNVLFEHWAIAP